MKRLFLSLLAFTFLLLASAQTIYKDQDSVRIEQLLQESPKENAVLYYARKFIGLPYVAHTLEVSDPERLVVNTRELDCTTLVETVLALAKTKAEGESSFSAYCRNLEKLRYFGGERKGYTSRLHYFAWWMHDNISRGNIVEICPKRYATAPMVVNNYYMSTKPQLYQMLRLHPEWISEIREKEQQFNGTDGTYIPEQFVGLGQSQLAPIADGDLVAIVTNKAGLDYSHLGFAVWGKDGKLHLLNASSIHGKVVEEPMTLQQYLLRAKNRLGIRCFRLNLR